jgi:hypothetical protein
MDEPRLSHEGALFAPPDNIIRFAVRASMESPCQSKRGAAIFDGENLVSVGHNHQPAPFYCDGSEACKRTCGRTAIHAEQMAILHAGSAARGAEILHIKTVDGKTVASDGPSCLACSKLVLFCGLRGMWLFHQAGWKFYEAALFHYQSGSAGDHMPAKRRAK